jgi:hypothetical protein
MTPMILTAEIDFGRANGGNYTLNGDGVSGRPFPSESEAWAFREGVKVLNTFMFMPYSQQLALLKQLGI